jgi:hypothetical protein
LGHIYDLKNKSILSWFGQPGRTCEKKMLGADILEKLHRIQVKKVKKILGSIFYKGKTSFFRPKNFNASTKTL